MSELPTGPSPTFKEALRFWLKLGFISFGGPTGQIAMMHEELVERKKWVAEGQFLHALNFCMLLPGPEAQQLATYIGWLLHRTWGGIVAGSLFVLPAAVLLWLLSWVYVTFGQLTWVAGIFYGLKPAVLAIVVAATLRIGSKVLKNGWLWSVAAGAFAGIFLFKVPFPAIVLGAGLIGFIGGIWLPKQFALLKGHGVASGEPVMVDDSLPKPTLGRALRVMGFCLLLWWTPVLASGVWLGWDSTLFREGVFFSKAAMVTFGGAYAVLPYAAQQAVESHGWLSAAQMMDGLGLAETTPGPLVIVLQFVGFMGGYQHPGTMPALLAATLGAAMTVWVTFVPCFLWIFLGAPYIERMRNNVRLTATLSAVTAAVVGVILNLAVWFGHHVLWVNQTVDWFVLVVAAIAFAGMWKFKWGLIPVVLGCGGLGLGWVLLR